MPSFRKGLSLIGGFKGLRKNQQRLQRKTRRDRLSNNNPNIAKSINRSTITSSYHRHANCTRTSKSTTVMAVDRTGFCWSGTDFVFNKTSTTACRSAYGRNKSPNGLVKQFTLGSWLKHNTVREFHSVMNDSTRTCYPKSSGWNHVGWTISWWRTCDIGFWWAIGCTRSGIRLRDGMWRGLLQCIWRLSAGWSIRSVWMQWRRCFRLGCKGKARVRIMRVSLK